MNDDLPYYTSLQTNGQEKPWLVVPYSMENQRRPVLARRAGERRRLF